MWNSKVAELHDVYGKDGAEALRRAAEEYSKNRSD